jgi:hypothetical protein
MRARIRRSFESIVANQEKKALNWAIDYAEHGIALIDGNCSDHDLKMQILYVLNNITHWRGDESVVVRGTLKEALKKLAKA